MFKNRCYNGGNKHHFESRFTEENSGLTFGKLRYGHVDEIRELYILNKYVADVCTWCGKVVNKEKV